VSGALWISSYVALAATVIFLCLAVAALYRALGAGSAPSAIRSLTWPLEGLRPGDPAPRWIRDLVGQAELGLAVLAGPDEVSEATATAVAVAAEAIEFDWKVLATQAAAWQDSHPRLRGRVELLHGEELASLRVVEIPVVLVLRYGHLVDAVTGVIGTSQVIRVVERVVPPRQLQHRALSPLTQ
jgi:hypothetical protein